MTANPETLDEICNAIRAELPNYLSEEFVIFDVTAENLPGPDDEGFVRARVILEDGHPKLDPQTLIEFSDQMHHLLEHAGIEHFPAISYSNRSELSL